MKKILVASSALVAVAFAGQAQASEPIKLSVGGYMNQWAGFADQEVGDRNNAFNPIPKFISRARPPLIMVLKLVRWSS